MSKKTILIVDDDKDICEALKITLENTGYNVLTAASAKSAIEIVSRVDIHMIVSDLQMDGMCGVELLKKVKNENETIPVVLITAYGTVNKAVEAMKNGATDFIAKPFEPEVIVNMIERYALDSVDQYREFCFSTKDESMKKVLILASKVAVSDATVMITGESGTGKEVLSRYIHNNSPRNAGPFIAINCAAIPENMLEATLFGYEKGAYTGAYQSSPGKFELAQNGTLLLDEVSEMDLALQAKLLRVLQEKEVERLGGKKSIRLDVRVLATSNRNLKEEVANGNFREDLYYRLNVFPLHLPPLRDRREDILFLANSFASNFSATGCEEPILTQQAISLLLGYDWPGNVRELENVMQRAMILSTGNVINEEDIHLEYQINNINKDIGAGLSGDMKEHEFRLINETLHEVNGNRKQAAERLGISQRTLRYKLARMRDHGYASL